MRVKDHYDNHLAKFYAWMIGEFNSKQQEQEIFFRNNNVLPTQNKIAFDLGCGHGLQSISLSNIGFFVKAVDFNTQLLQNLSSNNKGLPIEIINSDVFTFLESYSKQADVIVCMGDTLTHFADVSQVEKLIQLAYSHLIEDGKIILSFRDLTTELKNENRFIPVKQDHQRILTCFLEYFSNHVMVHDILYEKENEQWIQKVSSYPKLRLSDSLVTNLLIENKFKVSLKATINGMIYIIANKII